jgi:MHS family proline/betaine transporter-like MFS transporter
MSDIAATAARQKPPKVKDLKTVLMAVTAALIEGYDTTVFGVYAVVIGHMFFPSEDEATAVLLAIATFATGYLMRPIGALVLGAYADRLGRKRTVALVVTAMSLSTGAVGLLPTYHSIGVTAAILVVVARLVQGFAAGGSNSTAAVYIAELVPAGRRGLFISLKHTSQVLAFLFTTLLGTLIFSISDQSMLDWTWRIPFLIALILGPVGLYIRFRGGETQAFTEEVRRNQVPTNPLLDVVRSNKLAVVLASTTRCLHTATAFILLFFMPTYAVQQLGLPMEDALFSGTIAALCTIIVCPLSGLAADRIGFKVTMLLSAGATMLAVIPAFNFVASQPVLSNLILVQCFLSILTAPMAAVSLALNVELFPTATRGTGMSISDSFNTLVFGGAGSVFVTWLMTSQQVAIAPGYYLFAAAALSFFTLLLVTPRMRHSISA